MAQHYCDKCHKTMDTKEFYKTRNLEKYPDGFLNTCKSCITMHVDNWDPSTFMFILEAIDVPYIKEDWDACLAKYADNPSKATGKAVMGRYLSKMRLGQWKDERFADTEKIAAKNKAKQVQAMKAAGLSDEEIEEQIKQNQTQFSINKPILPMDNTGGSFDFNVPDEFEDQLTEEDKLYLKMKWGKGYRCEEWVALENLYKEMENSYDIQTAGHRDTLKMICKTSLKANQCLDANDIEGFQKLSKTYDMLMKSGRFTAAQNKEEQGEFIDSIGELVALCEKQGGFIPTYYDEQPKDKVDKILMDYQLYVRQLISEETNLEELVKSAVKNMEKEQEQIAEAEANGVDDDDKLFEDTLFGKEREYLQDEDFAELRRMVDEQMEEDNALFNEE